MTDLIKKTLLMGVGLAALTKDKVEELAREVAHNAKLSSDKGQEFVDTVVDRAERARADLEARVQRLVQENLKKAHVPTHDDLAALQTRVEQLELRLAAKST